MEYNVMIKRGSQSSFHTVNAKSHRQASEKTIGNSTKITESEYDTIIFKSNISNEIATVWPSN